jgi:hypothetical protein
VCWRLVALLDAGYGNNTALRDGITALGMPYEAVVQRAHVCRLKNPGPRRNSGTCGSPQHRPASLRISTLMPGLLALAPVPALDVEGEYWGEGISGLGAVAAVD